MNVFCFKSPFLLFTINLILPLKIINNYNLFDIQTLFVLLTSLKCFKPNCSLCSILLCLSFIKLKIVSMHWLHCSYNLNVSLRLPSGITNILHIMNGTNKSLTEIYSFGVGVCGVQPTKRSTHQVPRTRRWCQRKHNKLWWRGWWRRRHDSLRHHTAADTHRRTSTRDGSKAGMYVLPRALRQILVFFYNPRF